MKKKDERKRGAGEVKRTQLRGIRHDRPSWGKKEELGIKSNPERGNDGLQLEHDRGVTLIAGKGSTDTTGKT